MATSTTLVKKPGQERYTLTFTELNDIIDIAFIGMPETITIQAEGISASDLAASASNNRTDFYDLPTDISIAADGIAKVADNSMGFETYRLKLETANEGGNTVTAYVVAQVRDSER